jgi:hypothetical protein
MKTILAARLCVIMAIVYQLLLIMLILIRPDLPVYSTTISEWAIGRFGWLMQIAFFTSALCYLFLFISLKNEVTGGWGKTGLCLLFICFAGTIGVGVFVTDSYPPDFTITTTLLHTISGGLAMVLLPMASLCIGLNLGKNEHWINSKNLLRITSFLPIVAFAGFMIQTGLYVAPLGENAVGPNVPIGYPPRIMFLTYHVWAVTTAIVFIRKSSHTTNTI